MLHRTCAFAFGGIYGSRNAFRCIQAVIHRRTILNVRRDHYEFHKRHAGTCYVELDVDLNTSDTSTPTHNQISGPITRARAWQLNNQVSHS
jgi:hypothetical protein